MSLKIHAPLRATRLAGVALAGALLNLSAVAGSSSSSNLGFLNNTPIAYMKQPDMDSLRKAIFSTLDSKQDGETATWNNQGLGNAVAIDAELAPEKTDKQAQRTCRHLSVMLRAKGQSMNLHPLYCQAGTGKWQLQKRN
jgi:surface antigen